MKVTALVENNAIDGRDDLCAEFGLSLHAVVGGTKILFDMGATDAFASNAEAMGIDISEVDVAVVSHQHFDHGGADAVFGYGHDIPKRHVFENAECERTDPGHRCAVDECIDPVQCDGSSLDQRGLEGRTT